jgi:hypothetical protein
VAASGSVVEVRGIARAASARADAIDASLSAGAASDRSGRSGGSSMRPEADAVLIVSAARESDRSSRMSTTIGEPL